jgi:release factor glutamine methyltransferase
MSGEPYLASEDSALLRNALGSYSGSTCLELGAGNGGAMLDLARRFDLVVGTDLKRPGMEDWKEGSGQYLLADCASCLRDSSFDLVAFNPPYLREDGEEDSTVEGGIGLEVPQRFLEEALRVVRPAGRVVMLLNDQADIDEFGRICADRGFILKRIGSRRVFFEELSIYEASAASLILHQVAGMVGVGPAEGVGK